MLDEFIVGQSNVEAGLTDPDGLQHPRVPQLALDRFFVELIRNLLAVRLDASDEKRIRLVQSIHEGVEGLLELGGDGQRLFSRFPERLVGAGDSGSSR